MAEQQAQWLGNVLLAPRISHYAFAAFAIAAAAAILCLLFFASYTRKARINGWLVPQHGVVRVFSPATGVIVETRAREGALVTRGAPLFVLSTELRSEALGATREEIVRHLKMRRDAFRRERILHGRLHVQRMAEVYAKLEALQLEEAFVGGEIELQKKRLKLAEASEARKRALLARGVTSLHTAQLAEEERLNKALDLRDLEREQVETRRERLALEGERSNLPLQFQTEQSEIERQIASLEQQIAEAEANREIVIAAPQDGIVTSIQADVGSSTGTAVPLANIVPSGSQLEAQLFSPSRAIGFVRPGQHVLLRYQAFPYQKFGHYQGEVASVSRSAVSPNEMTQHLSGLTSLYGSNEPVYRITVSLERQTVVAYGRPIPLQPGMQLEADILIERRRLVEWVLDPLFTLTGKWRGDSHAGSQPRAGPAPTDVVADRSGGVRAGLPRHDHLLLRPRDRPGTVAPPLRAVAAGRDLEGPDPHRRPAGVGRATPTGRVAGAPLAPHALHPALGNEPFRCSQERRTAGPAHP